jgi:sodium-dependent multivitamin transporter 6
MLAAITAIDYGVLAFYLLVMLAVGFYFSRQQHTSKDFFLAGRSMGWFSVGLSIMATLLSALSYTGIPGEAYYVGLKSLLMPCVVWLTLPIMVWFVLPLYHNLGIYSIYEYLELRFDSTTRVVSSIVFVLWRLLWLGGVLYAPCKVLVIAAGLNIPIWFLLLLLGTVGTAYTFLGGMKAVIWTDVIQALVMAGGVALIIGGVWMSMDGGADRVWEIASSLKRTEVADTKFSWTEKWSIYGAFPHFFLAMLSFYIADQITAQRYLTAKDLIAAQRSFILNCFSVTVMGVSLMYVGMALLAFYHDHPQAMRPIWVVNVDGASKESITYAGRDELLGRSSGESDAADAAKKKEPLIEWRSGTLDASTIEKLVAEQRVLHPNSKEPFTNADELIDPATGKLDVNKLAMRRPLNDTGKGKLKHGEIILNKRANDELMPRFITDQLYIGVAGLILAALLAASMSSMDSGLNSICTLIVVDFHRRLGWGRHWLAAKVDKPVEKLTEEDELRLARPLVLVIGVAATLFSFIMAQLENIFQIMIAVINTFGGPLLAIFLLGMFTRRCTARGALASLTLGSLFTLWLTAANQFESCAFMWPFAEKLGAMWPLSFGVVFTLAVGYAVSLVSGGQKSKRELQGLVAGIGRIGIRDPEVASPDIGDFDLEPPREDRWK